MSASSSPTARWARCCRPPTSRLDDFEGLEGCNEILNVTRPDVVRGVHDAYFAAGADCVETNTFGANLANLGEYGIADRIFELSEAGARLAREVGRRLVARRTGPRCVLGSVGPGTKLPTLGHAPYATLRDAYQQEVGRPARRRRRRAARRDLPGPAAGQGGGDRRAAGDGRGRPPGAADLPGHRRDHRHDAARVSEIGAALTALEPLGIDLIGLNCATGPAEMSEHLRYLSQHARVAAVGDAQRRPAASSAADGAVLPADARRAGRGAATGSSREYGAAAGRRLLRHHAGAHPARWSTRSRGVDAGAARRRDRGRRRPRSTTGAVRQDAGVLMVGERTNANGSKAFREAMLGRRLARLRGDRPQPDPRRLAPARPVRRLRRPRRHRRHARDRRPVRHRLHAADHARLDRAAGDRGGPGDARRPLRGQLGQLRGRRRARAPGTRG